MSLSVSVAVTVIVVVPAVNGVTVTTVPETVTEATAGTDDTAE